MAFGPQVVVLLQVVAYAMLLGGLLAQLGDPEPEVSRPVLAGGWGTLVTGAGLLALQLVDGRPVAWAPTVTAGVLTAVVVLLLTRNRRFLSIPRGLWLLLVLLSLAIAAVRVLWQ